MAPDVTRENEGIRILAIDDEAMNLELLERSLRRHYDVSAAATPERALEILRQQPEIAIILSDYRMPGMNGAELLAASVNTHPHAKRVIITGYADAENVITAINSGKIHYLVKKPWNHRELHQVLEQLVHAWRLERENRGLLEELRRANDDLRSKERLLVRNLDDRGRDLLDATQELERINRELEVLSYKDSLTGLYNHRAFQERMREELSRAARYNQPLTLAYGDVDRFRGLNRELGYQIGDEILRRIAEVMTSDASDSRVRQSDVVARFAGEEFVVLMPETPKAGALTKAERLREAIADGSYPADRPVTMSFGLASFPDDGTTAEDLVGCARRALTDAKVGGRNCIRSFGAGDGAVDNRDDGDGDAATAEGVMSSEAGLRDVPVFAGEGDRFRTYHAAITEVVSILRRDRAITCLFVDLSRLRRIEIEFGVAQHAEVYDRVGTLLDEMRGEQLRHDDLICRTNDDDAYLCILSPARTHDGGHLFDLDGVAQRVGEALNTALAPQVRELIRDTPRITVGHARVLNNSMVRAERLVARLVNEAQASAALARERGAQRDKAFLQEIILGEGLMPVYQPIVHIESSDIFGYEALTRGPRQSTLESPASLFAVADEVDLTFELDRACFRGALRGAVGLEPVHRLFVNLLPLSFYDTHFIENEVGNLLDAAGLTPANIVFEITERLAIENFTSFRRALATFTAMGFGVAIDDVGTRHSNLETVMALRPHFIKISDVLTRGVSRSTVKREMMRSLGHIAETIDAVIVAEGIETPDDLVVLHDLGVKYGQGFFLARPGPPFPRLRASVRRAVRTLAEGPTEPIPAPPADFDEDYGEVRESPGPGLVVRRAVQMMAQGSGEFVVEEDGDEDDADEEESTRPGGRRARAETLTLDSDEIYDDFGEKTSPVTGALWQPLVIDGDETGDASDSGSVSLIESLRRRNGHSDPAGGNGVS